jgi:hypothetical protein
MRLALGWIALTLAGLGSAQASEPGPAPMIAYTVKVVETEGLCWRESALPNLKPITRQGAATVWTMPADAMNKVLAHVVTVGSGKVLQAPMVTTASGAPATIHCRRNESLVTQAVWMGGAELAGKAAPEVVRTGWHTTLIGRKLDQGILVRVVIEDTSIHAIHHLKSKSCEHEQGVQQVSLEVPEIASQEVAGEWLIPRGDVLLVSFGAYTVADKDGKAIVKERLAMIDANQAAGAGLVTLATPDRIPPGPKPFELPAPLFTPAPALVPPAATAPHAQLPMPVMPSRSFPQGVHADGKPAELPPLPPDEADDDSSSESAEPMPSPQTKKPLRAKPATDSGANKTDFVPPRSSTVFLPSLFMPTPSVGLQFLLPIKPLSLKLPFGQRLELEIYGRVISEPALATTAAK